ISSPAISRTIPNFSGRFPAPKNSAHPPLRGRSMLELTVVPNQTSSLVSRTNQPLGRQQSTKGGRHPGRPSRNQSQGGPQSHGPPTHTGGQSAAKEGMQIARDAIEQARQATPEPAVESPTTETSRPNYYDMSTIQDRSSQPSPR